MAVPLAAEVPTEGLRQDAAEYAKQYRVSPDEAIRRLQLQRAVSDLEGTLVAEEGATFAGMWIQHEPVYRVIARFTSRAAEERLKARVAGGPLAALVESRSARFSLADLEKKQKEAHGHAAKAALGAESRINVFDNKVEVYAVDSKKLAAAARMPDGVELKHAARLSTPDTEILGGASLSDCTAGFGVISASGELGIATGGHCNNEQYYQGIWLPFRAEKLSGDQEVQWNSTCDRVDVSNRINTGIGTRSITSTRSRTNQTLGTYLCKYGKATGRSCGTLADKNIQIQSGFNSTFIRVSGAARAGGDSGGPWFVEDVAYGIHWGGWQGLANEALYMAINYISGINVSVLTYDPGPGCNIAPIARYTYTKTGFVSYSFNGSTSSDADGSIVLYTWDIDGDVVASSSSPTATFSLPPVEQMYVTLTVTDNEGKTGSVTKIFQGCGLAGQPQCPF
jgi:hypothetical protein